MAWLKYLIVIVHSNVTRFLTTVFACIVKKQLCLTLLLGISCWCSSWLLTVVGFDVVSGRQMLAAVVTKSLLCQIELLFNFDSSTAILKLSKTVTDRWGTASCERIVF